MSSMKERQEEMVRRAEQRRERERLQDRADRLARQRSIDSERRAEDRARRRARREQNPSVGFSGISLKSIFLIALLIFGAWIIGPLGQHAPEAPLERAEQPEISESAPAKIEREDAAERAEPEPPADVIEQKAAPSTESIVAAAQDTAAQRAFESGNEERWGTEGTAGYAVPSEAIAGCRNVAISVDGEADPVRIVKKC